jgi:hypothetical protein
MRLRSEVEDCVDFVLAEHTLHFCWEGDISILEYKIVLVIEHARVVEGRAVIELVEGDDVVMPGIREDEVADEPASTKVSLVFIYHMKLAFRGIQDHAHAFWTFDIHEACPSSYQDVLRIGQCFELGASNEHRRLFPKAILDI